MKLKYDITIDISTGRSRDAKRWKNSEILWSDLVEKVSKTHRTAETLKEYMQMKKDRQAEVKDIGGFVGGLLTGGRRYKNNVQTRHMLTLDADHLEDSMLWEDYLMFYGNAACYYTTHKHCPQKPRFRILIPLDRPVSVEEHEAIARKVADDLGIDKFDDTTFQSNRLMFWPSTSKDGEFLSGYKDGPVMKADKILKTYKTGWQDMSQWPVSSRVDERVRTELKKQEDPLSKPGIIGAFCRTYSISEAIDTFLSDTYSECDVENRYNYEHGTTSAGLITYNDVFAYSHHGTDPISGKLCNAFDLVRIHMFSERDENVKEGTPINRTPSFLAMADLASSDKTVKRLVGQERLESARAAFSDLTREDEDQEAEETEPENDDWLESLDVDSKGNWLSSANNIELIFKHHPSIKGAFAYNELEEAPVTLKNLPWRKVKKGDLMQEVDDAELRLWFAKEHGISGVSLIKDGINIVCHRNRFHPVRDYLKTLSWDGKPRLEHLLIDYMGADDDEYTRTVTRKTLTAAVTRVFNPGVKFDYVLTMISKEGAGKSSLLKWLGGDWFSDSFSTVQGKEAYEQLRGVWIVEVAELAATRKADVEATKHFISKGSDRYRAAFKERIIKYERSSIFIATTNEDDFLKGYTGNRRFWPLRISKERALFGIEDLGKALRDQVWAEAVHYYNCHEALYLSAEIEVMAKQKQEEHLEKDEREGLIRKFLDTKLPENWKTLSLYDRREYLNGNAFQTEGYVRRMRVCAMEIRCELFGKDPADKDRFSNKDISQILKRIEGWEKGKMAKSRLYGIQDTYYRKT